MLKFKIQKKKFSIGINQRKSGKENKACFAFRDHFVHLVSMGNLSQSHHLNVLASLKPALDTQGCECFHSPFNWLLQRSTIGLYQTEKFFLLDDAYKQHCKALGVEGSTVVMIFTHPTFRDITSINSCLHSSCTALKCSICSNYHCISAAWLTVE